MSKNPEKKAESVVQEQEGGLLNKILESGRLALRADQVDNAKDMLAEFVQQALQGQVVLSKDLEHTINSRIAAIDKLLSAQLNEIMHHADFQKLEGSWRGLHHLVFESETSTMLKIRVLNVSKKDLLKDLERAAEFDQSALFKKIYEEEYGTFGGAPFGALIGDYEFGNHPQDMSLLEKISGVAAAANAPFISAASPEMFGWQSYTELTEVRDLAKIFDRTEYAKWRSFRDSEDSRYVGLTLPHTLMRLPYGKDTVPTESFDFEEDVDGKDHKKYLWGNAAYSYGTRLTEAFALYNWTVAIRGVEGGGLVQGLPAHTFQTDEGDVALKCPTEIAITDRRSAELDKMGLMPLVHRKNSDMAAFISAQSLNKPEEFDDPDATANAALAARLPYMFACCRFAHYLKCIVRDKIGSFSSREQVQSWLQNWILNYVDGDPANSSEEAKARKPLAAAEVVVEEVEGAPGYYTSKFYLKPHYQLEGLTVSLRLVSRLPSEAKG